MSMYIPEDLQFLRVYKCVNQVGRDLMLVVFKWGFTLSQDETLRTYLFTKNNFNNSQFKRRYDEDQKKKIDAYDSHNGLKFDVSVLFRLIQDTSNYVAPSTDPIWTTNNPTQLEYILHKIKKTRNDLTHTPLSLDDTSADQMIQEYKVLYLDFIEAVGIRYGRDVVKEKANLNKDIDELMNHCLSENEIQHLFTEQRHERSKQKMLAEGVPEMKMKYIKKADLNPLTLIDGSYFRLPVMRVYKELEIRACGRNSKDTIIDNNDILRLNHLWETVTDLKDAADLVILEGPTGSGKTTITKKVIAEWSTNQKNSSIKGLLDYSVLIYMECRNSTESLKNLLHSLMPKTFLNLKGEPEKALSDCPVLVVIDSLDELNENSETLFKELLELIKMENITGICTMRPTKCQDVFSLIPSELEMVHLESKGIPENQRGSFVEIYHEELRQQGRSEQNTIELMQHIDKSTSRLQEHLRYPINLVHLAFLWAIAPDKVKYVSTATELYSSIWDAVQNKLLERLAYNPLTKHLSNVENKSLTLKFLDALCLEAMFNLTRKIYCILPKDSKTTLENLCQERGLPVCDMLSAFLVTKNLWTTLHVETEYSISHTDMQEYLAACCLFNAVRNVGYQSTIERRICIENNNGAFSMNHISRALKRNNINFGSTPVTSVLEIFTQNLDIPLKDFQNVLKHLLGLFVLDDKSMSKNVAKDLVQLLEKSGIKQEDWLDIYAESKSEKSVVKYLRKLCGDMLNGDIIVRDSHLAAYAKLLSPDSPHSSQRDMVDTTSAVMANSMVIMLKKPPSKLPDLQLLMLHAMKLTCNVDIHLYYNWREPQSGVTTVIFNETSISCNLKVVRGSPNANELREMCKTLEKLYISICDSNHAADVLPMLSYEHLPKLRAISIHLKCGDIPSVAFYPPLNFVSSTNIDLFLSNVDDGNIDWVVEVCRALQVPGTHGMYHCLYFPNNQLTSTGLHNLVHRLKQNHIKILIRIGVTSDNNDEELFEELDVEATSQLRCRFLWYFSAERMEGW